MRHRLRVLWWPLAQPHDVDTLGMPRHAAVVLVWVCLLLVWVCLLLFRAVSPLQRKLYPRNWCLEPGHEECFGRLRVALRKPDGSPANPEVPTRKPPGV